jgi:tetratricopeptide (TPR) repeat protein/predicted Ser/Thr protein kinase
MGTVYEALDPALQRKLAVKTMIPGLADAPELRLRFLREAQAAGGLRHRNIVTVYDLGEDKGRPYIAMEYIEGTDLEKIIQNKEPLSLEWKLDVLRQVCEGLSYAHRHGIVHRDVKPANIRVTPDGEVKIMDFGIAHLQSSNLTKSGLVLGTVHYMAPEQIDGHKVDHRADVFSVGAIAYELFTYKRPFEAESITGVMYQIMHDRPDSKMLPTTPYSPGLERIIMKAMAREVEERYQSLDDMHGDLVSLVRETAGRLEPRASADSADTMAVAVDLEMDKRRSGLQKALQLADQAMAAGDLPSAREQALAAQQLFPEDENARRVLSEIDAEVLRRRVERELNDIRNEIDDARANGQLQRALSLCRRYLEVHPEDLGVANVAAEIEATVNEKQVEELAQQARTYAQSGDLELVEKIAGRIRKLAPSSPRVTELQALLDAAGSGRKQAEELTRQAQEHIAEGNLADALAAAEAALKLDPDAALAREIRNRTSEVVARQDKAKSQPDETLPLYGRSSAASRPAPPPPPPAAPRSSPETRPAVPAAARAAALATPPPAAAPPAATPAAPPPAAAAPAPVPVAAPPAAPPAPPAASSAPVRTSSEPPAPAKPEKAVAAPRPAPVPGPPPSPPAAATDAPAAATPAQTPEARKAEAEALTSAALNHFLQNNYKKSKVAVEKALALEPGNKKARELIKILGTLG